MSKLLSIVGLDPSLNNWGIAKGWFNTTTKEVTFYEVLTVHSKKLPPKPKQPVSTQDIYRVSTLYDDIYDHVVGADIVIAEAPIGGQDSNAAFSYAACISILGMITLDTKLPIITVTPFDVKKVVTKDATKDQMMEWVIAKHPEIPWITRKVKGETLIVKKYAEHVCDAIASVHSAIAKKLI